MIPTPENLLFILGTQRSGTTWLANIIDSSPDTLMFMEPLSPGCALLPGFPDHTYFLVSSSPTLDDMLQTKMLPKMFRAKYLLSKRSLTTPWYFRFERLLAATVRRIRIVAPAWLQWRVKAFQEINFSRLDAEFPLFKKRSQPTTWAIKELRLAGKVPVLLSAFPDARYLVIVRHPGATVHSILTWFGKGRLVELRRDLDTYIERIEVQAVAERYRPLIERCRNGSLAHTVALYWRISYERLYMQLGSSSTAKFLVYEELARDPHQTALNLFTWLGIPWSNSSAQYVDFSSTHTPKTVSAVTTVRDSARVYRKWCDEASEATLRAVQDIVGDSPLLSWFAPYYGDEWLCR